jgi:hypothetical protein
MEELLNLLYIGNSAQNRENLRKNGSLSLVIAENTIAPLIY